jgi:carboxymethylenebutenolidase
MPKSQQVTLGTTSGYLAQPGAGKPGVVVIQEWWGLVPHIKDVADRFARQGYAALAPDLYHGKSTVDAEEANHLMQGLDWGRAASEMADAVKYLRTSAGCTRVGVVGFCMGGALTMIAATATGDGAVDAYASFYGFPPKGAAPIDRITAPGIIFFGENENFFPVGDAQKFVEEQKRRGRKAEIVIYPGAGHAFFNDTRPEAHNAAASNDAWRRTLDLFGAELRG